VSGVASGLATLRLRRSGRCLSSVLDAGCGEIEAVLRVAGGGRLCARLGVVASTGTAIGGGTFRTASPAAAAPATTTATALAPIATIPAITTVRSLIARRLGWLSRCFSFRRCWLLVLLLRLLLLRLLLLRLLALALLRVAAAVPAFSTCGF
jgi:hypothetical protein